MPRGVATACLMAVGAFLVMGDHAPSRTLLAQEKNLSAPAGEVQPWGVRLQQGQERDKKQATAGAAPSASAVSLSNGAGLRFQPALQQPQQPSQTPASPPSYPSYPSAAPQAFPPPSSNPPGSAQSPYQGGGVPVYQGGYSYPVAPAGFSVAYPQSYPGPTAGNQAGYPSAAGQPQGYAYVAVQGPPSVSPGPGPLVAYPNQAPVAGAAPAPVVGVNLVAYGGQPFPPSPFVPVQQQGGYQYPVAIPIFAPQAYPQQPAYAALPRTTSAPLRPAAPVAPAAPAFQAVQSPGQQQGGGRGLTVSSGFSGFSGYVYPMPVQLAATFQPSSFGATAGSQQQVIPIGNGGSVRERERGPQKRSVAMIEKQEGSGEGQSWDDFDDV